MASTVSLERKSSVSFIWKLNYFNSRGSLSSEEIIVFGSRWRLRFSRSYWVGIYLLKVDKNKSFRTFTATSYIETQEGSPKFSQAVEVKGPLCEEKTIWLKDEFTEEDSELLSDAVTFVVVCTPVDAGSIGRKHNSVQTLPHMDPLPCFESLSSDFNNLLISGTNPDVTLKCEGHTKPAHRLVLSARSEVFSAMFSNDMLESRTGSVDIVDLHPPILDHLLQYLYSGNVTNLTVDSAQCLYAAGDKYAVRALKVKCRAFLLENLTEENACSILEFGNKHDDTVLTNAALRVL